MKRLFFVHPRRGFTLIELLVAIAIIGVIASIVVANLSVARAKARDAKRVSDIARVQFALQLYFDRCNEYPSPLDVSANNSLGGNCVVNFGNFISQIPTPPPGTNESAYAYSLDFGKTDYALRAKFEHGGPALADSFNGLIPWDPNFSCDNSSPHYYYCVRPR